MTKPTHRFSRRDALRLGAATAAAAMAPSLFTSRARAQAQAPSDPASRKLLFVVCAHGGADIIDSFLPVLDADAGAAAATLNCFPERLIEQPTGSAFRTVKQLDSYGFYAKPAYTGAQFVKSHGQDMAVLGHEVSSVNHNVGQQRSLNGAGFNNGRTIMEVASMRHGVGLPLPSCNMAIDGFVRHGVDHSVPAEFRHEVVLQPKIFGLGTHGYQGVAGAPSAELMERARAARDELDTRGSFGARFAEDARLAAFLRSRREVSPRVESAGLMEKLLLSRSEGIDPALGVTPDPLALAMREQLPGMDDDPVQAQLALSFLLAYHGASCSLTFGFTTATVVRDNGDVVNAPLSFDFSHNAHRETQGLMWSRVLEMTDKLIHLLKTHDYLGDPALGKMWDRSVVYIASEFGRDKHRPSGSEGWGSGHDLSNGSVILSPLIKGNTVYGGVDPATGLTYGFDPQTGAPDVNRKMTEADIYKILAHTLDVEFTGGEKYPGVVRGA